LLVWFLTDTDKKKKKKRTLDCCVSIIGGTRLDALSYQITNKRRTRPEAFLYMGNFREVNTSVHEKIFGFETPIITIIHMPKAGSYTRKA
jgi:hypothetical protein